MKDILCCASAALAFAALPSVAQVGANLTGNEIYEACNSADDLAKQGFCVGYIDGVVEGMRWGAAVPLIRAGTAKGEVDSLASMFLGFCIPEGATLGQYRDVMVGYLRRNPQDRHNSARLLMQLALSEAFRCPME